MATIKRTFEIGDITPTELAMLFASMFDSEQAKFFDALAAQTKGWGGMGWCGQCHDIAEHLTPRARNVIATLWGHVGEQVSA